MFHFTWFKFKINSIIFSNDTNDDLGAKFEHVTQI
jgi:hypothetical protein